MSDVLLHLSLIPQVGPAFLKRVLQRLPYEQLAEMYNYDITDLRVLGIPQPLAQAVVAGLADKRLLQREQELLAQSNIKVIGCFDADYPSLMQHMHNAPLVLYVQGTLPTDYSKSVAVVGSRAANIYGRQVVENIVPDLVKRGWLIVSGGALGIDTLAHATTLKAGGVTVAIIGAGLLRLYPASNERLFDAIVAQGGAVVSPFPLTMLALPGNFPARNQVIAGMTRGCLVMQAAARSGALITAHASVREGREVGAVPGPLFDPLSEGCHALIKEGAALIASANDVESLFGYTTRTAPLAAVPGQQIAPILLFCSEPRSFDELLAHEKCSVDELHARLWDLQVEGVIEEVASGKWQAKVLY